MAGRKRLRNPAEYLADDLIIDILERLPERPLCRCKCVSRAWRDLISGPIHHRRLALTDAASGFFYRDYGYGGSLLPSTTTTTNLNFTALCPPPDGGGGGSPPPVLDQAFPFLPSGDTGNTITLLDSCNGLLLLRSGHASSYIVCNPSTHGWAIELPLPPPEPEPSRERRHHRADDNPPTSVWRTIGFDPWGRHERRRESTRHAALAFDPAFSSSHFHVFELEQEEEYGHNSPPGGPAIKAVRIYSSETGEWVRRDSDWSYRSGENAYLGNLKWSYRLAYAGNHAYLNGFLHVATTDTRNGLAVVASVDTTGRTWRATRLWPAAPLTPGGAPGFVGHSQRRLLYVAIPGDGDARGLSVYALENDRGGDGTAAARWVLKHSARTLDPSSEQVRFGKRYSVVGIHPDCNVIFFFDRRRSSLIAYEMDRGTTRIVRSFPDATSNLAVATRDYRFVPYVPPYLV